jgi:LemA protein
VIVGIIVVVIVVLVLLVLVFMYNGLVRRRNRIDNAWSQIDVQLKRRYDLIPNLVESVKGYAAHEKGVFESVTQARSAAMNAQGPADQAQAENVLSGALKSLFAVAEAYPDLKANETFQHLQSRISGLENSIADRREYYNESVNNNNVRIEQFPDLIVARLFNFKAAELLEFSAEEKQDVDLKSLFNG